MMNVSYGHLQLDLATCHRQQKSPSLSPLTSAIMQAIIIQNATSWIKVFKSLMLYRDLSLIHFDCNEILEHWMNQISLSPLGLSLNRGIFIHKQFSEFPSIFSVPRGSRITSFFISYPFQFACRIQFQNRLWLCDSDTLGNLEPLDTVLSPKAASPPEKKQQNASVNWGQQGGLWRFRKCQKARTVERDFFWGLYLSHVSGRYVTLAERNECFSLVSC